MNNNWLGAIWKPKGVSSFKVLSEVKKKYGTKKVGHMGTLDPLAEGVLPVAVGRYTKLIPYVNLLPKVYEVEVTFGVSSHTLDAEGVTVDILEDLKNTSWKVDFDGNDIESICEKMIGTVDQIPPIFSALKIDGVRAYKLARDGKEVEMKSRKVECYGINLLEFGLVDGLWRASLRVECGKGYYVRSFVRDLCDELNVKGYMSELARTKVGEFDRENLEIQDLKKTLNFQEFIDIDEKLNERFKNGLMTYTDSQFEGLALAMFEGLPVSILKCVEENGRFGMKVKKNI
jgi:tRNA pseudouridine55 synthase